MAMLFSPQQKPVPIPDTQLREKVAAVILNHLQKPRKTPKKNH